MHFPFQSETAQSTYEKWCADEEKRLTSAALAFGELLKAFRRTYGWSQDTTQYWRAQTGLPLLVNAHWSKLERGLMPRPSPKPFIQLGNMNYFLAKREFPGVTDPELRLKLVRTAPFMDEDGYVWRPPDFWGAFCGVYSLPALISPAEWLGLSGDRS